ncbi:MAG: nucleotide exchange factor GrpE [Thermodesulfovibrionales bacterium]|nr:nucleotide exchange factor GrpE [Thermodesulfovibrionales bacterium]
MQEYETNETKEREIQEAAEPATGTGEISPEDGGDEQDRSAAELQDMNNKYLRLYAEFENYKKRVTKDKEELIKYGNEGLLYDLLPVVDSLEMALQHAADDVSSGLVQGVELTLKEMRKSLEKYGLIPIEAEGKPFDPAVHHAMAHLERDDVEENIVVEEYRKGYMFRDKVLRASLVAVSKKNEGSKQVNGANERNNMTEEES